jgi:hypothetical protein
VLYWLRQVLQGPTEWRSGLRHCITVRCNYRSGLCHCRDWETHEVTHNYTSIVWVRGGFGRPGFPCPIAQIIIFLATPCGGLGACKLTSVASWMVFPPTHCVKIQCSLAGSCFGGRMALNLCLSISVLKTARRTFLYAEYSQCLTEWKNCRSCLFPNCPIRLIHKWHYAIKTSDYSLWRVHTHFHDFSMTFNNIFMTSIIAGTINYAMTWLVFNRGESQLPKGADLFRLSTVPVARQQQHEHLFDCS